jgi:hypothetical protein
MSSGGDDEEVRRLKRGKRRGGEGEMGWWR